MGQALLIVGLPSNVRDRQDADTRKQRTQIRSKHNGVLVPRDLERAESGRPLRHGDIHTNMRRKGDGSAKKQDKDRSRGTSRKSTWSVLITEGSPVSKERRGGRMKHGGHIRPY